MEKKMPAPDGAEVREGVRKMDNQQIKETLEKQLQLLSERSAVALSENNLAEISHDASGCFPYLVFLWLFCFF